MVPTFTERSIGQGGTQLYPGSIAAVILSFSVDQGFDLRCRVVEGSSTQRVEGDSARSARADRYRRVTTAARCPSRLFLGIRCVALVTESVGELAA